MQRTEIKNSKSAHVTRYHDTNAKTYLPWHSKIISMFGWRCQQKPSPTPGIQYRAGNITHDMDFVLLVNLQSSTAVKSNKKQGGKCLSLCSIHSSAMPKQGLHSNHTMTLALQ